MEGDDLEDHFMFNAKKAFEITTVDTQKVLSLAEVFAGILFSAARGLGFYQTTQPIDHTVIATLQKLGYRVVCLQYVPVVLHRIAWTE